MSRQRRAIGTSLGLAAAVACGVATLSAAAQVPAEDAALAETLFREAKRLMAEHAYAAACPKLAESQRLDPGGGTLLTLALCHEAEGRTATAWAEFTETVTVANQDGRADRASIARRHAEALEPRLSRLVVRLDAAAAETPGLQVRRDEQLLARAAWGVAVPVDPGRHHLVATAPGKKTWSADVEVGRDGTSATVDIGALEDLPPPSPPSPASTEPPRPGPVQAAPPASRWTDGRGIAGLTVGGAGLVVVGASIYLALHALSEQRDSNAICPAAACPDPTAVKLNQDARTSADLATAGFVAGGAALAGGALLLFLPRSRRPGLAPMAARGGGGVLATASW